MKTEKIAIIGLGYVGLPLAVEFGKKKTVIGFDIDEERVKELKKGSDRTLEVTSVELAAATNLSYSSNPEDLLLANIFIITVPTPIDEFKTPDLTPLKKASTTVGKALKKGDVVIYESTVFPGCTEEICIPVLERNSGLTFNKDFFCGYSPERINPGDKTHRLPNIKKVTSGSTPEIAEKIDQLYQSIITAGTHLASSIKVAEAAKVIENAQRDLNIAFVNELALIFDKLDIDTTEVLNAASTKWNFLPFKPGLVGGHCIGVDPYYLTYKAESIGYNPQVIMAGRRINDTMGIHIANKVVKLMTKNDNAINNSNVLVLGITFKEDCPDIRNSKVIDVVNELEGFGINVDVYDPLADKVEVHVEYGLELIDEPKKEYQAIILAVRHTSFLNLDLPGLTNEKTVIFDIKSFFNKEDITARL
ncbi:nucleotide sugar dehydrogenase [Fulvivirga sp. M361]|uniref:nucleotide sugar dehydrogenase n=1 Tax=Fulvivirga sp. M361 TaxID=2594266 RepID=UPI001179B2DB|nr:nucleotide sugar dehydrogenase [Fulvivirga sp. M361]TRX50963.1 nucleotide sugar dehydrogenase [Fulvivirga sp. M361]